MAAKILDDGDHIKTGDDGFGALVYLDDKSTIKIHTPERIVSQNSGQQQCTVGQN